MVKSESKNSGTGTKMLISAALLLVGSARASADELRIGQPTYGGTGCPNGTAAVVLDPEEKSLSILFDEYTAEAGGVTGRTFDRKSCNLAVPVHVPRGVSVAILEVDYRGFTAIPAGGLARFSAEYFFAGQDGVLRTRTFQAEDSGEFLISNQTVASRLVWSECGADSILRVNSNILAVADEEKNQTLASVDSADARASVVYRLKTRRCN